MNRIDYEIQLLLDNKYDIELQEYWKLTEEEKDSLSDLIVKVLIKNNKVDANYFEYYCAMMDDRRLKAEYQNEFERADIISRIREKLIKYIQ
jgi:galactose-1-phosphate uridylyltransferase